ncbi:MAG: PspC domain-containing protein [Pseudohongiellaceae bacterium]
MSTPPNSFRIDREHRRFLGVCAGIANYLDLPPVLIRVVFLICVITWPPLIAAYFIVYFLAKKNITADKLRGYFNDESTGESTSLYRNTRDRWVAGVCSGIANYLGVEPIWIRIATIISFSIPGPFTGVAYIVLWCVLEPDPRYAGKRGKRQRRRARRQARKHIHSSRINSRYTSDADYDAGYEDDYVDEFDQGEDLRKPASADRQPEADVEEPLSLEQCVQTYDTLETRLRGIEAFITSRKFKLHCELNRI